MFYVKEKTKPQYLYEPHKDGFVINSYVFGIDKKAEFKNFVKIVVTEEEAIKEISFLNNIA